MIPAQNIARPTNVQPLIQTNLNPTMKANIGGSIHAEHPFQSGFVTSQGRIIQRDTSSTSFGDFMNKNSTAKHSETRSRSPVRND